jgi:hypothetical protein
MRAPLSLPGSSPPARRCRLAASVVLLSLLVACQMTTPATVALNETVIEIGDAVNALRDDTGAMQAQIDSLRTVVARQDSAIARLSAAARVAGLLP